MVTIDTLEGLIDQATWYHYDVGNDVLCIRLASKRHHSAIGEEADQGYTLLRDEETDEPIGVLVISWWKRFGVGELPDSMHEFQCLVEPWARKIAA